MLKAGTSPCIGSAGSCSSSGVAALCSGSVVRRSRRHLARGIIIPSVATVDAPATTVALNQDIREGSYEAHLVQRQARKRDDGQPSIASALPAPDTSKVFDVAVVGAGPAGMYLAAQLAKQGLSVVIIGRDMPIVNNYGVWSDEFEALGLSHTLECSWPDAVCYFGEGKEVKVGRAYGRVSRRKLRETLLDMCGRQGVCFLDAEVSDMQVQPDLRTTHVTTSRGAQMSCRLVTVAAGAAAGKFLQFEEDAPSVAAQTAYGIEAEVEGYGDAYSPDLMTFMDFRRHHTGLWDQSGLRLEPGKHPANGEGVWGTAGEAPSFLYAMPLGGNRVFLEETCLVAKPALPFAVLKRRLDRRLKALGIRVTAMHEEEWSYIPVGGPLPLGDQSLTAFGAAANMVHPATGFSVSRSFREAPIVAEEMAAALKAGVTVPEAAQRVWNRLWPQEKRTQASFHVFGMELLASLDLQDTNSFFQTFFNLPTFYWRGFLASQLTASQLIAFAMVTFVIAQPSIKFKLVQHLFTDPAGEYLINAYKSLWAPEQGKADKAEGKQQQDQQQQQDEGPELGLGVGAPKETVVAAKSGVECVPP